MATACTRARRSFADNRASSAAVGAQRDGAVVIGRARELQNIAWDRPAGAAEPGSGCKARPGSGGPISSRSSNPAVGYERSTRAPLRSSRALVATVEPCTDVHLAFGGGPAQPLQNHAGGIDSAGAQLEGFQLTRRQWEHHEIGKRFPRRRPRCALSFYFTCAKIRRPPGHACGIPFVRHDRSR